MKIEGFVEEMELARWQEGGCLLCVWREQWIDGSRLPVVVEVGGGVAGQIHCSACGEPAEIVADLDMTNCCHARVAGEEA